VKVYQNVNSNFAKNYEKISLLRKSSDFISFLLFNFTSPAIIKITVMNIERTEFIAWMERIMERFDILKEQMLKNQSRFIEIDGEQLLDNQDVLQLLKISSRSLQRYRTDKKLPYYTISGKLYYKLSDVHQLIRESLSSSL
jgi:hypothetical protein